MAIFFHKGLCLVPHCLQLFKDAVRYDCRAFSNKSLVRSVLNSKVYGLARETPLDFAPSLSDITGNTVLLKREDLQPVFSFKIRGAYNKIAQLSEKQKAAGVVCCSAGNHAQGVAMAAQHLNIRAKIFMPTIAPTIKVNSVLRFGAEVCVTGNSFDDAAKAALECVRTEGKTLVHPFDDLEVIAGQGTIGLEIVKQIHSSDLDGVFICCGGGGMLAGVGSFIKEVAPNVKIFGVEAADAPTMTTSLRAGKLVELESVCTFADGAAVKKAGINTFEICKEVVDDMVLVSTDDICAAVKDGFTDLRVVLEPAGALAIAGLKKYLDEHMIQGGTYVAICSGANMDFNRLRFVAERADTTERLFSIIIPEKIGEFKKLYDIIHPREVTEFAYRITNNHWEPHSAAYILMSIRTNTTEELNKVFEELRSAGYEVVNLDDNEIAKVHGRHMIGGALETPCDEVLYSCGFPKKPGAMQKFLYSLKDNWNVSLFHYRDHGADIGRVLVGIQVPAHAKDTFQNFLDEMSSKGYMFDEQTDNKMYVDFLRRTCSRQSISTSGTTAH